MIEYPHDLSSDILHLLRPFRRNGYSVSRLDGTFVITAGRPRGFALRLKSARLCKGVLQFFSRRGQNSR